MNKLTSAVKVLVVDDQPEVLAVLTSFLEAAGAEVAPSSDPADAVEALTDPNPPSLGDAEGAATNAGRNFSWRRTTTALEGGEILKVEVAVKQATGPEVTLTVRHPRCGEVGTKLKRFDQGSRGTRWKSNLI